MSVSVWHTAWCWMHQKSADPACSVYAIIFKHDNTVATMLVALLDNCNDLTSAIDDTVISTKWDALHNAAQLSDRNL